MPNAGIGAFFGNAVKGYDEGLEQNRKNEELAMKKAEFGLNKQRLELELEAKKREEEFQKDLTESMKKAQAEMDGSIQGEVTDEQGNSLGVQRFAPGQVPAGLRFREGTVIENKPLDDFDRQMRIGRVMVEVAERHGKVDWNTLEQANKLSKRIKTEGAIEATRYMLATGDEKGAKDIFNRRGIKIGDDTTLSLKQSPFGGMTVVGTRVGKDGKPEEFFDSFRDIVLPSAGAETYINAMNQRDIEGFKQKNENVREGAKLASHERINDKKIASEEKIAGLKGAGTFTYKDEVEGLGTLQKTALASVKNDPDTALQYRKYEAKINEAAALARTYVDAAKAEGKQLPYQQAWNIATTKVFENTGLKLPGTDKKK